MSIKGRFHHHETVHMLHVRDHYYAEFWIIESGDVWGVCLLLSSASHLQPSHPLFLEWWPHAHAPPNLPNLSPRSLKGFWWPRGKLLGVQVEFSRRPSSLSLSSPRLSRHMKISHGFLLTWDQPGGSKPPGMAVVILSPVPRALCLIK